MQSSDDKLEPTQALKAKILRIEKEEAKLKGRLPEMYDRQHFLEKYSAQLKLDKLEKDHKLHEMEFYRYIEE